MGANPITIRIGQPVEEVFKQLICFFFDGTHRHLLHFDHLKSEAGHAEVIETDPRQMRSSHAVKRFLIVGSSESQPTNNQQAWNIICHRKSIR